MNILNLPRWTVKGVEDRDEETVVEAVCDVHPTACIKCGSIGNLNGGLLRYGTNRIHVADTPAHGKRTVIEVLRQRYRCRDCKAVFVQPLPDLDERGTMTLRLVAYIERESLRRTFTSIAEEVGVTEGTVRNVFHAHVKRLDETFKFETPRVLGIDELHLLKQPRCVLTNVEARTVLDLLPTRTKDAVYRRLLAMPSRERVRVVTMDMWPPYRDSVRAAMPKAVIVVDKYHVLSLVERSMERVRKGLRADLPPKFGRDLMRNRFILLKRPSKLKESEMLLRDVWLQQFPTLAVAYRLKEAFHGIYEAKTPEEARGLYAAWKDDLTVELQPQFKEVTTALSNWDAEIFNYFDHRVTNAYTEAFNGLTKIANRTGRGYSFEVIRAKMLYTAGVLKPKNADRVKEKKPVIIYLHHVPSDHEGPSLEEWLKGISIDQIIVTFNYEDHLDKALESTLLYE